MIEQEEIIERKATMPLWARIVLVIIAFMIVTGVFEMIGALLAGVSLTSMESYVEFGN